MKMALPSNLNRSVACRIGVIVKVPLDVASASPSPALAAVVADSVGLAAGRLDEFSCGGGLSLREQATRKPQIKSAARPMVFNMAGM